ncbi:helix-turn-helix transcriptional regulator [Microvirga massiliensis]|uniref:helix-turn-helix transcriptional regulator n=1 Tax=Microvirga massiliensis TaxID=1033741 RepID=UPI00062B50AF|nr:helix-turn-helix transcriptional regulator [Microvirga massiliensis]
MISVRQLKAARALLDWSQQDLADASGVSKPTIARLETADGDLGGYADTRDKLTAALERAGIVFLAEGGPGVQLKRAA